MKLWSIASRSVLSIMLSAFILMPLPALAAISSTEKTRLEQYEKTIFGKSQANLSEESRIKALEKDLFGKSNGGSTASRLDAIAKVLGKGTTSKLFPPMAAQLDPAGFSPQPSDSVAPQIDRSREDDTAYSGTSSPAPVEATPSPVTDRSKELLKQALLSHNQGRGAEAERLFKQVLSMDGHNADANFNLGAMSEEKGDLQSARNYYAAAAAASPGDRDVADALSAVNDKQQQKLHEQQIAKQTQSDLQRKSQLKQVASRAASAYKAGNYDAAINDLNSIARQEPNDPNVQFGLGQAFRGKGDLNRARQYLSRAVSLAPDNQLYKTTLSDLDHQSNQRTASSESANAPDYGRDSQGLQDYGTDQAQPQVAQNDGTPPGQITPFNDSGAPTLYGHAGDSYNRGGMLGGLGSSLGFGGLGGGLGAGMVGGSRMKRVVGGSLAGAAAGAFANMHSAGGVKSGAMRGAVMGGLMGLLTGF